MRTCELNTRNTVNVKKMENRIASLAFIAFGIIFGANWGGGRYCIGDKIFYALGLPAWSKGESGVHYPAIIGVIFILVGIGIFKTTLQGKARQYATLAILLILVLLVAITFGL